MQAGELRESVLRKVAEVANSGDEETIATALGFAKALLLALASYASDQEAEVDKLTVGTGTAARILGLHPEYVRHLIRHGDLQATKENGEFRMELSLVVDFMERGVKLPHGIKMMSPWGRGSYRAWPQPQDQPQAGEEPA